MRIRTQQGNVTICLSEKPELTVCWRLSVTSPLDSFLHLITETQTAFKRRDETDLILNYRVIGTQTEHYIGLSVAYLERLHEKVTFVTLTC